MDFDALGAPGDGRIADSETDAASVMIHEVQSSGLVENNGTGDNLMAPLPTAPLVGHTIVAVTWNYSPTGQASYDAMTLSDNAGNTYVLGANVATPIAGCDGAGSSAVAIYVAGGITATHDPFVVTTTPGGASTQEIALFVGEYSGVTTFDQGKVQQLPGSASPMMIDTGPTMLTASADELLVAAATSCSGNPGTVMFADNNGFTARNTEVHTNSTEPGTVEDKVVNAIGMYSASWTATFSPPNNPALAAIVTVR